ncbi:exosortase A [Aromatoleum diolicum]|uniref:Exosortase A n=1 Tax=Aromatoleum diolicum TaxID=75796 RepID=A0ABX1QF60_9RHOO|nr:exosortase A [Aromatoleum diolicum]NMG75992.1 exosortase A [Aromatoleum diolicum]
MSAPEHEVPFRADGVRQAGGTVSGRGAAQHLVVLAVALVGMLWWYRDTVASLVEIWNRSDTYAHGFLVAPISIWLIWRNREQLRNVPVAPSLLGMLIMGVAGFAWLLGELAGVASVSQFALVGMVIALVWAVMGTQVARALAFPLGFLFFLVPFGEFLFPTMMDRTTDFVIWGLRLSGVPVYAEGRSLVIPSGNWAVVEGCSGVRYLIASVVVGSLYAHLTYRSLRKRLIFVALSVALPILANWLRAYGIVMLAHLSDNRLAAGVDHLIYGWVFFGLVMLALFWVGGRWREDLVPESPAVSRGLATRASMPSLRVVLAMLAVALAIPMLWPPLLRTLNAQGQHGPVNLPGLQAGATWHRVAAERVPEWKPHYSGMRGELREVWDGGGAPVGLYVGYYRNQRPGEELINSANRVLKYKDKQWRMAAYGEHTARLGEQSVTVRDTEVFDASSRLLVWHWYWVDGRWTSSDYVAKLYQAASRLRGGGDDSAVVMIYAPVRTDERAKVIATLERFALEMGSELDAALARAMEH